MNSEMKKNISDRLNSPVAPDWKNIILMTLLILAITVLIFIISYFYFLSSLEHELAVNGVSLTSKVHNIDQQCRDDWSFYKHDVVGISFCYPSEWGEVVIEPISNITKLEGLTQEFANEDNYAYGSFFFNFSKKQDITMRFFNEDYKGERYSNGNAYKYGYVDNINELKQSGDICIYRINFDTEYENKMREVYGSCDNGIKTTIIEDEEHFDRILYTSSLNSFVFDKLKNGYFDNLLVTYYQGSVLQKEQKTNEIGALLEGIGKKETDFNQEQSLFASFVASIKTFVPTPKIEEAFQEINGEDSRITAIRKYYWLLSRGDFKDSYAIKLEESRESFEIFWDNYKNVYSARPYDFQNVSGNTFKFYVDYQDNNESKEKYAVTMEVIGGKLKTIFSEKLVGDTAKLGEYSAFSSERGGRSYMILRKGDQETVIEEGQAKYSEGMDLGELKSFSDIRFSKSGEYLIYSVYGYEGSAGYVYDIGKGKTVLSVVGTIGNEDIKFTPDEKYLYVCVSNDFSGHVPGEVYSVPGFQKIFSIPEEDSRGYATFDCEYEENQNKIIFRMGDDYEDSKDDSYIEYSFR